MAVKKPRGGGWKYEDLFELPDDGKLYEIIHGELYELPPPNWDHQTIQINLVREFLPVADRASALLRVSPIAIFISGVHLVEPDLLVVMPERQPLVSERGLEGSPDLIIEILSPSNRRHDLQLKWGLHAEGDVREYWIVDPEARAVEALALRGGEYETLVRASGDTPVQSEVLPGLSFPASRIFA